ncbi:Type II secretion system protein D, partial [Stylophora pistillata]
CWAELQSGLQVILTNTAPQGTTNPASYTLHKQAGLISVFANQKQHKQIQQYLSLLKRNKATQVFVEAKIVEVALSDKYQSGINWHSTKGDLVLNAPFGSTITPGKFNANTAPKGNLFSLGSSGKSLTSIAGFLSEFGTVRTLSSPRVTVMNNQSAVLKVATNQVFFRIDYTREVGSNDRDPVERASSQIQTVPIGLVMVVHPSINPETGQITLTLRPTISRVTGQKEDPAVNFLSEQTQKSLIPEVQVRELDTVLKIDSGEVIVLGGLMEERSDNKRSGLPGGQDLGILDTLFSGKDDNRSVNELVILLRATIIEEDDIEGSLNPADKDLYKSFTKDPRPFTFAEQDSKSLTGTAS